MQYFFTYQIFADDEIVRIGKGHCLRKSNDAVLRYLSTRYGKSGWTEAAIAWHQSEAASLKRENSLINDFEYINGRLPLWNRRRGGGGRQIYHKCKSWLASGTPCRNDALASNYGYCGVHR